MKAWNKQFLGVLLGLVVLMIATNIGLWKTQNTNTSNTHIVQIHRLKSELDQGASLEDLNKGDITLTLVDQKDLSILNYSNQAERQVVVLPAKEDGMFYLFSYPSSVSNQGVFWLINGLFILLFVGVFFIYQYIRKHIVQPFHSMNSMAEALAHRDFAYELPQEKDKFFGKFIWAMDVLREELKYYQQKDIQRMKEKKLMIASLSHDIKTPLSSIRLYNEARDEAIYPPSIINQRIEENCDKIDTYIKDIMETNKEDLFDFSIQCQEIYMVEICEILEKAKEQITMALVDYQQAPCQNNLVVCDPFRIKEVIHNVIDNALKYGDGKWLHVSFYEEDHHQIIKITNSSNGIDIQDINALFQCFYRGNNISKKEGHGLGLYICKQLMTRMDGDIFMSQAPGEVSFHIVLGAS